MVILKALLVLYAIALTVNGQTLNPNTVLCPFPNPEDNPATSCELFSACSYLQSTGTCHMDQNEFAGYVVVSKPKDTRTGLKVHLKKINPLATLFQNDILDLVFEIINHEDYHLQIKIYDPNNVRYEVPYKLKEPSVQGTNPLYSVEVSPVGEPFTFSVTRRSTNTKIFQLLGPLTFEDQFIQITTPLTSEFLYGFGENSHHQLQRPFDGFVTPIFPRDEPVGVDHINHYGHFPYYVNVEDDEGNTHSVLFYSSNAFEYRTFRLSDDTPAVTMRNIGGIVDLHFFLGPNPEEVNKQYTWATGNPGLPIYWSLGFHLSRYGYGNLSNFRKVVDRMLAQGIPLDSVIIDIDYMYRWRAFTYDAVNWEGLPKYITEELHPNNLHISIITEPAVVIDFDNYLPGRRGFDSDIYIKWSSPHLIPDDQPSHLNDEMVGYVWPDTKVVFADYFNPVAVEWWTNESIIFHEELPFDGYWIDMNEPANFGTNLAKPFNWPESEEDWSLKCPFTKYDSPPFPTRASTHHINQCKRLSDKTLCMEAILNDGEKSYLRYDVHPLHGHSMAIASYKALEQVFPGQRPFILSRSTFPGSGRFVTHWTGDNIANWDHLRLSIVNVLELNIFGVPNVGVDICGFFLEPSEELCARWMQAGAFFPFSRNHNTIGEPDQDPAREDWPIVQRVSRATLMLRYKYNPFLYTLFYKINQEGGSVIRPMFSNWPKDLRFRNLNDQFMWGTSLLIAPIVTEGDTEREVFFPEELWYDLVEGDLVASGDSGQISSPLDTNDTPPVFIRGGTTIPFQEPAVNTILSRQNPFGLTVALDSNTESFGELFWDDGQSILIEDAGYLSSFSFSEGELIYTVERNDSSVNELSFNRINVYGYPQEPANILVNNMSIPARSWIYNVNGVLGIDVDIPMNSNFVLTVEQ